MLKYTKAYEKHQLISLMSHAFKAFLKIIYKRMYNKCKEKSNMQFGLKNNLNIKETLYYMQLHIQKYYDK